MSDLTADLHRLKGFHQNKDFTSTETDSINQFIAEVANKYMCGIYTVEDIQTLNKSLGDEYLNNTLIGHSLQKPFGYAGDFMIIDKIYLQECTKISNLIKWDKLYHQFAAPQAVRNRKKYFIDFICNKIEKTLNPIHLLNIASGPARDVYELYNKINPESIETTCIEYDKNAIEYAKKLNSEYLSNIKFINKNIVRYNSNTKFDIIWSAGLFDYFNDELFLTMLQRFSKWTNSRGEIVIGNFSPNNPTRDFMEILMDWKLIYRSKEALLKLAMKSGFKESQIEIAQEPLGVNLFIHIYT